MQWTGTLTGCQAPARRCACFSASIRPPSTTPLYSITHQQHTRPNSVVCQSSILPSVQLQQELNLQQPPDLYLSPSSSCGRHQENLETIAITDHQQSTQQSSSYSPTRRGILAAVPALGSLLLSLNSLQLAQPPPAAASKLGPTADSAWEALGGGPADLTFPENWLGVWDVTSTLVAVELPMGEEAVPNIASVQRAKEQDLEQPLQYQVAFMRNPSGKTVYDRRFNTAALLAAYYGSGMDFAGRIDWNPKDPNALSLQMPSGLAITTRVLRRSEEQVSDDRFETSEFIQQVFETEDAARPRVKASQCFTKYKFRDEAAAEAAGGPTIVATQVVSDYLTPFDGEQNYLAAGNKPVTTYTYKMAFKRHHDAAHTGSALAVS